MESPYDVLGVDADADESDLTRAYRERVKETHPDQGGSAEEFQLVRAAYEAAKTGNVEAFDADEPSTGGVDSEEFQGPTTCRVEYVDYAVLDDYGWGLRDDDLFEKAANADLGSVAHGEFVVDPGESLLEAAEREGFAWPFACRGGACANCAVLIRDGDLSQPTDHILPEELSDRGIRLSCNGMPLTEELRVVYNVKHLPELEDLRLPPYPFELANATD